MMAVKEIDRSGIGGPVGVKHTFRLALVVGKR